MNALHVGVVCLLAVIVQGLLISDKCSDDESCPDGSMCRFSGCDGRVCVCRNGTLPTANKTRCIAATQLGNKCDVTSACMSPPFSDCIEGQCACISGFNMGDSGLYGLQLCLKDASIYGNMTSVGYNKPCDATRTCIDNLACIDGACRCSDGYRPSTYEELFAVSKDFYLCKPGFFKLDQQIDTTSEACKIYTSTTQRPTTTTLPSTTTTSTTISSTSTTSTTPTTTTTTPQTSTASPTTSTTTTATTKPTSTTTTSTTTTTTTPTTSTTTTTTTPKPITSISTTIKATPTPTTTTKSTTTAATTTTPTTTTTTTTLKPTTLSTTSTKTTSTTSKTTTTTTTTPKPTTPTPTTTKATPAPTTTTTIPTPITTTSTATPSASATPSRRSTTATTSTPTSTTQTPSTTTTVVKSSTMSTPINVTIGENCEQQRHCPKFGECVQDSCDEKRCRCKLGYASSDDRQSCLRLSALGQACSDQQLCQGPYTVCKDGQCQCKDEFEPGDTGLWCRLKKTWFIDFPLAGEECSGSFWMECYYGYEQECKNDRCQCKEGSREVKGNDTYAVYPDRGQCRSNTYKQGEMKPEICKTMSRGSSPDNVYDDAKHKARQVMLSVIGGVIGLVVLISLIITVVVLVRWKRRGKRRSIKDTSSMASTERYSIRIPRPFADYTGTKEYDSNQISYPNVVFDTDHHSNASIPDSPSPTEHSEHNNSDTASQSNLIKDT